MNLPIARVHQLRGVLGRAGAKICAAFTFLGARLGPRFLMATQALLGIEAHALKATWQGATLGLLYGTE